MIDIEEASGITLIDFAVIKYILHIVFPKSSYFYFLTFDINYYAIGMIISVLSFYHIIQYFNPSIYIIH